MHFKILRPVAQRLVVFCHYATDEQYALLDFATGKEHHVAILVLAAESSVSGLVLELPGTDRIFGLLVVVPSDHIGIVCKGLVFGCCV